MIPASAVGTMYISSTTIPSRGISTESKTPAPAIRSHDIPTAVSAPTIEMGAMNWSNANAIAIVITPSPSARTTHACR
ncbi:hypothetical protein D3C83_85670 [compost metagenome]